MERRWPPRPSEIKTQRGVMMRKMKGQAVMVMRIQETCHTGLARRTSAGCTDLLDKCQVQPTVLITILAVHSPFSVPVLSQRVTGEATVVVAAAHSGSSLLGLVYHSWVEGPSPRSDTKGAERHSIAYQPGRRRPSLL